MHDPKVLVMVFDCDGPDSAEAAKLGLPRIAQKYPGVTLRVAGVMDRDLFDQPEFPDEMVEAEMSTATA